MPARLEARLTVHRDRVARPSPAGRGLRRRARVARGRERGGVAARRNGPPPSDQTRAGRGGRAAPPFRSSLNRQCKAFSTAKHQSPATGTVAFCRSVVVVVGVVAVVVAAVVAAPPRSSSARACGGGCRARGAQSPPSRTRARAPELFSAGARNGCLKHRAAADNAKMIV